MPPNHEKPQNKKGSYFRNYLIQRAENGTQTRDPQLGRLVLYQLSYFRIVFRGQRWIRTTEGESQQIYSLPHLATLVFAPHFSWTLFYSKLCSRSRNPLETAAKLAINF